MTEKQHVYEVQDTSAYRAPVARPAQAAQITHNSHLDGWQTSKPFEIRFPTEVISSGSGGAEKTLDSSANIALTYSTIMALKTDLKSLFENYLVGIIASDKIKLISIRNSLISTLVNDYLEFAEIESSK